MEKEKCCEKCYLETARTIDEMAYNCRNIYCPCHQPQKEENLYCGKGCKCVCHQEDYPLPKDLLKPPTPEADWEKRRFPKEMLLMNDCPKCGQEVNREFVEKVIDEIIEEALSDQAKEIQERYETVIKKHEELFDKSINEFKKFVGKMREF